MGESFPISGASCRDVNEIGTFPLQLFPKPCRTEKPRIDFWGFSYFLGYKLATDWQRVSRVFAQPCLLIFLPLGIILRHGRDLINGIHISCMVCGSFRGLTFGRSLTSILSLPSNVLSATLTMRMSYCP